MGRLQAATAPSNTFPNEIVAPGALMYTDVLNCFDKSMVWPTFGPLCLMKTNKTGAKRFFFFGRTSALSLAANLA